jgi:hypothetical protein
MNTFLKGTGNNAAGTRTRPFAVRGLMLDSARLTERHDFYFDLLPQLARWGFNTLWWHFVDDEGFALKLEGHPEIASSYAFSKPEMRRFLAAAKRVGIEVVPEVECLGHARYLTQLKGYAHLEDGRGELFNAICPSHPETLPLLEEIVTEVADLFDSPFFHAGLDEVNLAGCRRCQKRGSGKPGWWIYTEHVKAMHQIITACGKRMIMWADHVEQSPKMLRELPKDIILAHWQYRQVQPEALRRSVAAGFQVFAAPSLWHSDDVIQPNAAHFRNLDEMVAAATPLSGRGLLGVVNTWWTPWRGLRDSTLLTIAYTGHALRHRKPLARPAFARQFAREYFALQHAPVARALWDLHELPIHLKELRSLLFVSQDDVRNVLALAQTPELASRLQKTRVAVAALETGRAAVRRHRAQYHAALLAAQVAATCLELGHGLLAAHQAWCEADRLQRQRIDRAPVASRLDQAADTLDDLAKRLDTTYRNVVREWDRTRHPMDIKKGVRNVDHTPCPDDALLGRLWRCQVYLTKQRQALRRQTNRYRRGGKFPDEIGNSSL